jgi:N-acetylglucosaminyldiphosphoundecaprenol N-acetyl-beta-D-mannosaminyltransferase
MNNYILGTRVDPTSYHATTKTVMCWAHGAESRYICVANVHMIMEAYDAPDFRDLINGADLVTPDGMPLVWTLRRLGYHDQTRVYGPALTLEIIAAAAAENIPIGFYGSTQQVLEGMIQAFKSQYPSLQIAYAYSPPFRALTEAEELDVVNNINTSGVRVLFVGLGCPKQERWMAAHHNKIQAVMLGVGAAFDFHAGQKRQAPCWMQRVGLEWLFRLSQEPGRLWRRYLIHNPRFVVLALIQLIKKKKNA